MKRHEGRRAPRGAHAGCLALAAAGLFGLLAAWVGLYPRAPAPKAEPLPVTQVRLADARQQAAEFISHYRSIALTPEQRKVMDEALSSIPAPCCSNYSMATCCCPCNLAKAAWGLSKLLIVKQGLGAPEVKAAVRKWIEFTNPAGYTGNACFTGGCERPFENDGCGGMVETHIH